MGKLIKYLFRYVMAVVFLFICLAAWVVFDGLHDRGTSADSALVVGHDLFATGATGTLPQEGLDRAIKLYNDQDVNYIIVTESASSTRDQADTMAKYLEDRKIPAESVIKVHHGNDLLQMGSDVAAILKPHPSESVIIVAKYYDIAPTKLALVHQNVIQLGKAHIGDLNANDAFLIAGSVTEICEFVGKFYLLPAAEKAKDEAQAGLEKAQVEASHTKDNVDHKLDSMSK